MWWVHYGDVLMCVCLLGIAIEGLACGGCYGDVVMCVCLSGIVIEGLVCVVGAMGMC